MIGAESRMPSTHSCAVQMWLALASVIINGLMRPKDCTRKHTTHHYRFLSDGTNAETEELHHGTLKNMVSCLWQ